MMNCKTTQTWMVEYADDVLDAGRRVQVQVHLAECAECARLSREIAATRGLLRALPPRQTSAQFEARLAERLAQSRRPASRASWIERLAAGLRMPPRALRPAFALCAGAVAVVAALLSPTPTRVPPTTPVPPVSESALVSQCVAQHQSAAAAQPLSDPAAQNLTASLGASGRRPHGRRRGGRQPLMMTACDKFGAGQGWRWRRCSWPVGRRWRGRAADVATSLLPSAIRSPSASRRQTPTPRRCCGRCWWRKTIWRWQGHR